MAAVGGDEESPVKYSAARTPYLRSIQEDEQSQAEKIQKKYACIKHVHIYYSINNTTVVYIELTL